MLDWVILIAAEPHSNPKLEIRNSKQIQNSKFRMFKTGLRSRVCVQWLLLAAKWFQILNIRHSNLFRISIFGFRISKIYGLGTL